MTTSEQNTTEGRATAPVPKGYWIAHVTVSDAAGYQAYRAAAAPPVAAHGGRFLALGGAQDTVEGSLRPHSVIVEFPSLAAARRCYHSPEYLQTVAMRAGYAEVDLCIVEGRD